jgi:hypothetical protein
MVGGHASSEDAGIGFSMLLSWGTARQGVAIRKDHCCRQSAEVSKATPCNTLRLSALPDSFCICARLKYNVHWPYRIAALQIRVAFRK